MKIGLQNRMDRLFNRHGDGRAICVAADHGYMSDVTPNVVNLRATVEAVIAGGVDGILLSPGQALRLAPPLQRPGWSSPDSTCGLDEHAPPGHLQCQQRGTPATAGQ